MSKLYRYTAPITVNGVTYSPAQLEARDRAAFRAADLHASGYKPKPSDLEGAPRIDDWQAVAHVDDKGNEFVCLHGVTTGHPQRPMPHPSRTSMIIAMDEAAGWARTYSRYYLLGTKHDASKDLETWLAPKMGDEKRRAQADDTAGYREISEPADGYDPRDHGGETYPTDRIDPEDDDDESLVNSWRR